MKYIKLNSLLILILALVICCTKKDRSKLYDKIDFAMTKNEVLEILGEPARIEQPLKYNNRDNEKSDFTKHGFYQKWVYHEGDVYFNKDMLLITYILKKKSD